MRYLFLLLSCAFFWYGAHAQLLNTDFENWYTDSIGQVRLFDWEHLNGPDDINPGPQFFGTWQESNSQHGQRALKLSRWYNYTWDAVRQRAPINYKPAAL